MAAAAAAASCEPPCSVTVLDGSRRREAGVGRALLQVRLVGSGSSCSAIM